MNQIKLSIIVPFFNVERYIFEALNSLSKINDENVEIILIDDASTDRSAEVAIDFAKRDNRFTLLKSQHVGPGEARNTGIRLARGKFLGFMDADDVLLPNNYMRALNQLEASGCDFITCAFDRLDKGKSHLSPLSRGHVAPMTAIKIEDNPDLIFATTLWNKIFKKDFFTSICYPIPIGTYEDFLPNLKAFSSSENFDCFAEKVIHWRIRETNDSLTQEIHQARSTLDRVNAIQACLDYLSTRPASHGAIFLKKLNEHDVRILRRSIRQLDDPEILRKTRKLLRKVRGLSATLQPPPQS